LLDNRANYDSFCSKIATVSVSTNLSVWKADCDYPMNKIISIKTKQRGITNVYDTMYIVYFNDLNKSFMVQIILDIYILLFCRKKYQYRMYMISLPLSVRRHLLKTKRNEEEWTNSTKCMIWTKVLWYKSSLIFIFYCSVEKNTSKY
jgi:hypothetical protein